MAFYLCADFSGGCVRGIFRVGPEGNRVGGVYLGCLARNDANIRVLPHLRREGRILCRSNASPRFRLVRRVVRNSCPSFAATDDRHAGNLLFRGGTFYSAGSSSSGPTWFACTGTSDFSAVSGKFCLDVEQRQASQSCETGAAYHKHFILVVLQQHRRQRRRGRGFV